MKQQFFIFLGTTAATLDHNRSSATGHGARLPLHRFLIYAILSLAEASASASLTILFETDFHFCKMYPAEMSCGQSELSVILAFINCAFISTSAVSMFWLTVSL
ncbi:hypothetical protein U9M48_034953 [Paspalum notatum var. saurae]|uniref:CASP-like protein n=1 Tax=Paspalum notatum var. saurae TaxID=547442 RepID=A0AAQ3UDR2_PASNO